MTKDIFVNQLQTLGRIATMCKQKMIAMVYYTAMKRLKDFDDRFLTCLLMVFTVLLIYFFVFVFLF